MGVMREIDDIMADDMALANNDVFRAMHYRASSHYFSSAGLIMTTRKCRGFISPGRKRKCSQGIGLALPYGMLLNMALTTFCEIITGARIPAASAELH